MTRRFWVCAALLPACASPTRTPLATATIGAAGGELSATGGPTLVFPPGALAGDTTVSIYASDDRPDGLIGKAYRFDPEGTTFAKPVTVRFPIGALPTGVEPTDLAVATADASGHYAAVASVLESGAVSAQTTHFSPWALVTLENGVVIRGVLGISPTSALIMGSGFLTQLTLSGSTVTPSELGQAGVTYLDACASGGDELVLGTDTASRLYVRAGAAGAFSAGPTLPGDAAKELRAIAGAADGSLVIAVGEGGRIATRAGGSWQDESTGTARLRDVVALASGEAIAVGDGGALDRQGGAWAPIDVGVGGTYVLAGAWARGDDVWVAGWQVSGTSLTGVIVRRTAGAWATVAQLPGTRLLSVAGNATAIYAAGDAGTLLRSTDGTAFAPLPFRDARCAGAPAAPPTLNSVWAADPDVWAVAGASGAFSFSGLDCAQTAPDAGVSADAGPGPTGPVTVTFGVLGAPSSAFPDWAAVQTGADNWVEVPPGQTSITFDVTDPAGRYGVAYVHHVVFFGSVTTVQVHVLQFVRSEVASLAIDGGPLLAPTPNVVSGTIAHATPYPTVEVGGFLGILSGTTSYRAQVPNGVFDIAAINTGANPAVADHVFVRRGVTVAGDTTVDIDFSPATAVVGGGTVTVTGDAGGTVGTTYLTGTGPLRAFASLASGRSGMTYPGVPPSARAPGDCYAVGYYNSIRPDRLSVGTFLDAVKDVTLDATPPPVEPTANVALVSDPKQNRFVTTLTPVPDVLLYTASYSVTNFGWAHTVSKGYADAAGNPGTVTLALPDFANQQNPTLPRWRPLAWNDGWGPPTTSQASVAVITQNMPALAWRFALTGCPPVGLAQRSFVLPVMRTP